MPSTQGRGSGHWFWCFIKVTVWRYGLPFQTGKRSEDHLSWLMIKLSIWWHDFSCLFPATLQKSYLEPGWHVEWVKAGDRREDGCCDPDRVWHQVSPCQGSRRSWGGTSLQHLAVVEVGSGKPSVVMKRQNERCARMFSASQRQKVQRKQKSVMRIKVVEIGPEIESKRNPKYRSRERVPQQVSKQSFKGSQVDESGEPQGPLRELRRARGVKVPSCSPCYRYVTHCFLDTQIVVALPNNHHPSRPQSIFGSCNVSQN